MHVIVFFGELHLHMMAEMLKRGVPCVDTYLVKQCILACDCDTPVDSAGTHAAGQ